MVSVSDDRSIRIWSPIDNEMQQVAELYGHRSRIWAVRETKDMIASVSEDSTCKIWESSEDKPFDTLRGHSGKNVRALATFSSQDKDLIATGGEDGAIKIWDIEAMKQSKTKIEEIKRETNDE